MMSQDLERDVSAMSELNNKKEIDIISDAFKRIGYDFERLEWSTEGTSFTLTLYSHQVEISFDENGLLTDLYIEHE